MFVGHFFIPILMFQSLFYWITYSYRKERYHVLSVLDGFNPYFIGLPILIGSGLGVSCTTGDCFNPYFIGLPILIFCIC